MSSTDVLIPKDPPTYESLYNNIPSQSSYTIYSSIEHQQQYENQGYFARATYSIKRFVRRHSPCIQTTTAAIFVAATISATIMLLLWQLQNLASPQNPSEGGDSPWFDPSN
ncbi:hypothetical protein BDF20DRAFT_911997 [Mycotypha africana]|uniref:uncharacterized protein n=1 Tax=Mycotypha africana TaxID=64632 RepID=UPI0023019A6C|nr:uncharacterized protein BDF20DRAFT_911997 [Mycotypha africana]KAI8981742.1 hypothetical protein BDF20DRAFT_911997 [Mycotypha africana]